VLDGRLGDAVTVAARRVAHGEHDAEFPIDVVHGGGGTAANMNANEVIANLAEEVLGGTRGAYALVHPNDHVNRSQSTNDVYPTVLALAAVGVGREATRRVRGLAASLQRQADAAGDLERLGRTCLQDAVGLSVRDTHAAQAHAVLRTCDALDRSLDALLAVPLGATAVGTGLGAPPGYREHALQFLAEETALPVHGAENLYDALQNADPYVDVAAQAVRVALVLGKIAADLRLLASGPEGGIGEVVLPAVQVGSSIMPGKVNPVMPELVLQVGFEARGTATIVEAAAAAGELELNVMEPVIARHLLGTLHDLGAVAELFAARCIDGLVWDAAAVRRNLAGSLTDTVLHATRDGYAAAARSRRPRA
jgi:aspartate ammonia-lyase